MYMYLLYYMVSYMYCGAIHVPWRHVLYYMAPYMYCGAIHVPWRRTCTVAPWGGGRWRRFVAVEVTNRAT